MKILHCADIHLDCAMNTNFNKLKAKERNNELLLTFKKMVKYAYVNYIDVVIIAGDLFDTNKVSITTANELISIFLEYKDITFFYIQGNHDDDSFIHSTDKMPDNLKLFGNEWISYRIDKSTVITAIEQSNSLDMYEKLNLNKEDYNIVIMHGQISQYSDDIRRDVICLNKLKNKHIDYLALGHIHEHECDKLDGRGIYCYPGCLEGRGFDEIGEHGFVILDTKKRDITFVPFSYRKIHEIKVDVTKAVSTFEVKKKIDEVLQLENIDSKDMVSIILVGSVDVESEINMSYLNKQYENEFYLSRIRNMTTYTLDYTMYMNDISLKGEFIRNVLAQNDLSDEDKFTIIRYGIKALKGEEID